MPRIHGTPQAGWWDGHTLPTTGPTGTTTTWVGNTLKFTKTGRVFGISYYDGTGGASSESYAIGVLVADQPVYPEVGRSQMLVMAPNQSAKFMHIWFHKPLRIDTTTLWRVAVLYLGGGFYRTNNALTTPVTRNNIQLINGFQTTSLDIASSILTTNANANAVDVLFQAD